MSQYNTSKCFFPDGITDGNINPPFVPCDPLAKHSACCAIGESCIGNGLCYSDDGGIYRGACTDSTWKDPACSDYCVAKNGDQESQQSAFQFLGTCVLSNGSTAWSCFNQNTCGDGNTFAMYGYGIQQLNISGLASSAAKQSAAIKAAWAPVSLPATLSSEAPAPTSPKGGSNIAASSSPSCESGSGGGNTVAVGAGVGVSLGVLFLAALVGMLFYRHKYIKERDSRSDNAVAAPDYAYTPAMSSPPADYGQGGGGVAYKRGLPSELSDSWPAAREMR